MASIAPVPPPANVSLSTGSLLTVMYDEKPHIVIRPAVESLELDYSTQLRKLKTRSWACVVQQPMQIPGDDQIRSVAIVPVRTFLMLLATINENRVAPHARPALIAFQNETADAIEAYWTKGEAIRPQAQPRQINQPKGMTPTLFRQVFFSDVDKDVFFRHLYRHYLLDQRNTRKDANGELTKDGYRHGHPRAGKGDKYFQLPEDMWIDPKGRPRGRAVVRPDRVHDLVEQLIKDGLRHNLSITRAPGRLALTTSETVDGNQVEFRRGA
ncbi:phage antirepressor N-terminal domain-containing protein [Streptomyces mirabilis]|uniref:phage antirepressor N-terminal domain-containing protein n=1 Tax=Streptomyces mirabilis TaxID=68239 RepID=UPI00369DEC71